jgi:uncharacterized protein (TIGR00288 family)
MALSADDISMALFCDFENIALGVRDAQYEKFDIKPVLERLLLKGSIVVKKAYCDWDRYKSFKAAMHEANFELIEIPHVRQSGKNSADIRMVVDALDLCYTKTHVNTFVIISGDSDFSPLVSKLRENAKRVIGVGVKQSTSDLLIANCDEFIYIDDLVRKRQRDSGMGGDRQNRKSMEAMDPQEVEIRRLKGLEMAVSTLDAMLEDRADDERVWASVLKEAIKRRHPGFNENYHGYRSLGAMLEDAHKRGLLEFGRDERSSAYVKRRMPGAAPVVVDAADLVPADDALSDATRSDSLDAHTEAAVVAVSPAPTFGEATPNLPESDTANTKPAKSGRRRGGRGRGKPAPDATGKDVAAPAPQEPAPQTTPESTAAAATEPSGAATPTSAKKPARSRQPRSSQSNKAVKAPKATEATERKPRTRKPKASPPDGGAES